MAHLEVHTQAVLVQLHATLAPIKRLPPEILAEIFEHCLDVPNDVRGCMHVAVTRARSRAAPLLLGRVCRAWCVVAHGGPRLWRDVCVNVCEGRYSDALHRDALLVLQTWLARSGSLPLRLVVLCKTERVLPGLVDLFETIGTHAVRWRTVHVRLQNAPVIYRLVCRALSRCTALSTLDVTDGGQRMSFFSVRQGLRDVQVEDMQQSVQFDLSLAPVHELALSLAGLTIQDVHVRWGTLTRLSFMQDARASTSSLSDYMAILQHCTLLQECGLVIDSGMGDAPLEPLTLPNLACLVLQVLQGGGSSTAQTGTFLSVLHGPRLCTLSIEDYCPRHEAVLYHGLLEAFLRAHAGSLRRLRFSTSSKSFTSEDMVGLIVETPLLTELEYRPDEASSPRELLEALTPRVQTDGVACLLVCLERLFVYWDMTEMVSMVGDMIERRYALAERVIAQLKHLSCKPVKLITAYDCVPPFMVVENLAVRLESLCRCGLQVDWEAYRYDLEFAYC